MLINKKNSIFVVRTTRPDADSRLQKTVSMLLFLGYVVTVIAWDRSNNSSLGTVLETDNGTADLILFKEIAPHGRKFKNFTKIISFNNWLSKVLESNKDRILAVHSCDLDTGLTCKEFCKKNHIPMIYDIYDFYSFSRGIPFPFNKYVEKKEISIVDFASQTIICSEERKSQISKSRSKNIEVIYNSPIIKNIKEVGIKKPGFIVKLCYVGVLSEVRLLKEIINEIPNHPNYQLHIGGIGPLKDFIESKADDKSIFYYGPMKYSDVLILEQQCDILFATYLPSIRGHKMSAPNKVYESMAIGKPIIVCHNTSIDKLVENTIGFACEYDAKDFFEKCDKLFKNGAYERFAQNGLSMYPEFSYERNISVLKKIYDEVL